MADERGLAAAVLADDRDALAGRRCAGRRRRARACRPGRRTRALRARSSSRPVRPDDRPGVEPARRQRPGRAGRATAPRRPSSPRRSSSSTVAGRPVERRSRPRRSRRHAIAQAVEQVGLVLGDEERACQSRPAPGGPRPRGASPPGRAARSARRARGAPGASPGARRWPRAGSGRPRAGQGHARRDPRCRGSPSPPRVRSTVSRTRQPEVHRPEGDLLEHRGRDAGQLRGRVLEGDADPFGELVERSSGGRSAVDRQRACQRAADRGRRQAATRRGRAWTCPRRWPRRARRSRRRASSRSTSWMTDAHSPRSGR